MGYQICWSKHEIASNPQFPHRCSNIGHSDACTKDAISQLITRTVSESPFGIPCVSQGDSSRGIHTERRI